MIVDDISTMSNADMVGIHLGITVDGMDMALPSPIICGILVSTMSILVS